MFELLEQADRSALLWVNQFGTPWLDSFWVLVTRPETWIPFYAFFLFLIIWSNDRRNAILTVVTLLVLCLAVLLFTDLVKELVGRIRPNNLTGQLPGLRELHMPESYSFFSGHASSSLALSTFVYLELRRRWKWVYTIFLWPLLFVSSRLFVGVHYPSDIIVGGVFGFVCGYLAFRLVLRYKPQHLADIT